MAEKVWMPQLGESVTEGTISKWLVKVGDTVKMYDPICEVNTDKVNAEVPSSFSGMVIEIVAAEGETVEVGALICYISAENQGAGLVPSAISLNHEERNVEVDRGDISSRQRYSPAVLKLAQENNLDLTQLKGTGAGGRITRKDVLAALENTLQDQPTLHQQEHEQPTQTAPPIPVLNQEAAAPIIPNRPAPKATQEIPVSNGDQVIPLTNVRKTIANRMVQSKHDAPHAWTMIEVDVTNLVEYRNQMKDQFKKNEGISLTYLPFFIKAVVDAIKEFPILNSVWARDKIIMKKAINISIAVATADALYVPVIKEADQKNILGLAKSIDELVRKTREGKLTLEDMSGGTFTCNNTGSFGSVLSAPIINQPQAAILSMEAIVKRPVVINHNMIAIRDMVNLCLSLDHRVLDGLVCGRFLQSIKQKLESYGPGSD